jgi:hypothetical protein
MRRRFYIIFTTVITTFTLTVSDAEACRCAKVSLQEALNQADVIFAGVATASSTEESIKAGIPIEFEVSRVWKGMVEPKIKIATIWTCEQAFEQGKEYLVFARHWAGIFPDGMLGTTLCDRTVLLADAKEDVALLCLGKSLLPPQVSQPQQNWLLILLVAGGIVLALTVAGGVIVKKRLYRF